MYRCVPGLNMEVCCGGGELPDQVKKDFAKAVRALEAQGVKAITGDFGLPSQLQGLALQTARCPVFMSPVVQLHALTCIYSAEEVVVLTPRSNTCEEYGCHIAGFEASGDFKESVDAETDTTVAVCDALLARAEQVLEQQPNLRAFLIEGVTPEVACSRELRRQMCMPV